MAKSSRPSGPTRPAGRPGKGAVKLTRAERKQAQKALRAERKQRRRDTFSALRQSFSATRAVDNRLIPYMVIFGVLAALVMFLLGFWLVNLWVAIPFAIMFGVLAALLVLSRRVSKSMYAKAEGQPGAAGWMLQNQMRGDWRTTQAVAGTTQLDVVHRVIGRPGVVLVGEGAAHRVKGLIAQEKKKIARVTDSPIYDVIVGTGEDEVSLQRLNRHLVKLPRNLSKAQVDQLEKRLSALTLTRDQQLPRGPLPQGAKMRNVQRAVRRRS